ncbi:MAG: YkgJ family cysteine cluster protein [Phycisphaerales bacterium]|nr:MAG: YkgJ family cysteine cluster protein [Phycisphaerales bacterium]
MMAFRPSTFDDEDRTHAAAWKASVMDESVVARLDEIYNRVGAEIAERRPLCEASGRCCNFAKYGHLLYVTGLEAACTIRRARVQAADPVTPHRIAGDETGAQKPPRSLPVLSNAPTLDACPFLDGTSCGVHTIKPLGCRVYFCDPTAQEWQHDLSERALGWIRDVHDELGVSYRYAEWRWLLALLDEA